MARSTVGKWFFGDDQPTAEEATTTTPTDASSPFAGERDQGDPSERAPAPTPPGWYLTEGTLRYFDGEEWTQHFAPPSTLTTNRIAGAVFLGVFAALFLVWLGAQIDSDHIYFPVKFVVEEVPDF